MMNNFLKILLMWGCLCILSMSEAQTVAKEPPFEIRESCSLKAADLRGPIIVRASGITIDGNGLVLQGSGGDPKSFKGVAIFAEGVSNVTLRNIKANGWETGLKLVDCTGWTIENCDFSDNFHDPDFGWGENGRRGGMVFERVTRTIVRKNRANRVWDACVLVDSDSNTIESNDFSRTSNTCLKLWHASQNKISGNNFSYGIRIKPNEVHARDSTSVLIESGSNDNTFLDNDCTHGGDGIFVRVLNGWCSTGNRFERNNCSYANNNGFECWAPDNTFIDNKANHCSYGFWLGGSDHTRLEGNEASFNGLADGYHNSPHLPQAGHAGIVFMFGPSSHTVVKRNRCVGNNGAGIAAIGDLESKGKKWKAYHWIIEGNTFANNRWGIYLQYADWIHIAANRFSVASNPAGNDNSISDVEVKDGVTRLTLNKLTEGGSKPTDLTTPHSKRIQIEGPSQSRVGEVVTFRVIPLERNPPTPSNQQQSVAWDFGDGATANETSATHLYQKEGFVRLGVNVYTDSETELAWRDLYVVRDLTEIGTEGDASQWTAEDFHDRVHSPQQTSVVKFRDDPEDSLIGKSSLHALIQPYAGFRVALQYTSSQETSWDIRNKSKLVFWMRVINEDVTGWQGGPFFVLQGEGDQKVYIEPKSGLDLMRVLEHNEGRSGWRRMEIPLGGNEQWHVEGAIPDKLRSLSLGFDSWGAPTLRIWIDGLGFVANP